MPDLRAGPGRAAAVIAVAALAVVLVACQAAPAPTSGSEIPTASAGPTTTATPQPTVSSWTGLNWSSGVLGTNDQSGYSMIDDVLSWGDGYVGVGSFSGKDGGSSAAFFTSTDGLHWTITYRGTPLANDSETGAVEVPHHLVPVGSGLLAVGGNPSIGEASPKLWRTEDGLAWSPVDSPSWRDAWTTNTLIAISGGPTGLVAVGAQGSMCCLNSQGPPVISHSADGLTWRPIEAPALFDGAFLRDVAAYPGGFVIVGRVGEPDDWRGRQGSGVGIPAAWTSRDGVTWVAARVEGSAAAGATLSEVVVGADGLFATGLPVDTSSTVVGGQGPTSGWASADGQSWRLIGQLGTDLPYASVMAGDGTHMVMFGRESCKTTALQAWASSDGVAWTRLVFTGSPAIPEIAGPICQDDGTEGFDTGGMGVTYALSVANGVLVVGSGGLPQEFWFATAVAS